MISEDLDIWVYIYGSSLINALTAGPHGSVVCSYGFLMLPARAPFLLF